MYLRPVPRRLDNEWLVTDAFFREWRFWLVPLDQRFNAQVVSRWDLRDDPIAGLVYFTFNNSSIAHVEAALDLAGIYDALTGSDLSAYLALSTRARPPRLRGIERDIEDALYRAVERGELKFARHQIAWPFPERDEQPPSKRDSGPTKEEDPIVEYPFSM